MVNVLNQIYSGLMIYFIFNNMSIAMSSTAKIPVYVAAILAVIFKWDTTALSAALLISVAAIKML